MSAFKAPRGVGLAACVAMSLSLVVASGAFAAARPQIHPFAQQATLTANAEIGHSGLGSAVALSSDGNTALIGGPDDNEDSGAVWVFTRRDSTWTQQAKLTGGGEIGSGKFGTGVALSSDGKTALIGGPSDNSGLGAAWVFTRRGSIWRQRGSKLTGGGEIGEGEFGTSVALSSKGNTALIGGPQDNESVGPAGAAWVFTRSGSTWTQQGEKLTGGGEDVLEGEFGYKIAGLFGTSVALSSNGNTALIGGPGDHWEGGSAARGPRGSAWVFTRSGRAWTQLGEKLAGGGGIGNLFGLEFGRSVALSADGDTALIGGPKDNWAQESEGAAWVFTRSDTSWTQQGEKLKNSEPVEGGWDERSGESVALSADGDTALIGGTSEAWACPVGCTHVFVRSDSVWTQQHEKFAPRGPVALSADGTTALVGTAVFVNSSPHK